MKKVKLLLLFVFIFVLYTNVYASTNTFIRTNNNLRVPKRVQVTPDKINSILSTPSVSAKEKIYDFADLLTDAQEEEIYKSIIDFNKQSGYDALIVTTTDIGDAVNTAEYADYFYKYNDFGDVGLIFVIKKTKSSTIYMCPKDFIGDSEIGNIYSEGRIHETLKYIYENNIRNGDYYSACTNYVKILSGLYSYSNSGNYRVSSDGKIIRDIPWVAIITLSLTSTFIVVIIIVTKLSVSKKNVLIDSIDKCVDESSLYVKTVREKIIDSEKR